MRPVLIFSVCDTIFNNPSFESSVIAPLKLQLLRFNENRSITELGSISQTSTKLSFYWAVLIDLP